MEWGLARYGVGTSRYGMGTGQVWSRDWPGMEWGLVYLWNGYGMWAHCSPCQSLIPE